MKNVTFMEIHWKQWKYMHERVSCEVYECKECFECVNKFSEIKLHIENVHDKTKKFYHLKMNRKQYEKVDIKEYSHGDV